MPNELIVFNIREYLEASKEKLEVLLSEFSCNKNIDVEEFLKIQSIEFTKKSQSVTYLVFTDDDLTFVGYFTIAIKPISIKAEVFSNTMKRKIARVSEFDEENNTYSLSAYLIAQLGKNYANNVNERISGETLLGIAINTIKKMQYMVGGLVVFLESVNAEKLIDFYERNGLKRFATKKMKKNEQSSLIQMLTLL